VNQGKVEASWTDEDWKVTAGLSYSANHFHTAYYTDADSHNDVIAYVGYGPASNNPTGVRLPSSLFQGTISLSNFISGWSGSPVPSLIKFNPYDYYNYLASLGDPQTTTIAGFNTSCCSDFHGKFNVYEDLGSPNQVNEDNIAPYVSGSAKFTVDGMPLTVNGGVRFESTRMKSYGKFKVLENIAYQAGDSTAYVFTFGSNPSVVEATHNYSYFLPNVDAKLQVRDDMAIRVDASVTMTRPSLGSVVPNESLGGRVGTLTGSNNNADLKPYLSRNFDIAEEWYFAPNSYFSVDTFFKQVTNFNVTGVQKLTTTGVVDPYTGSDAVFNITTQVNGPMANVYGVEIALQYMLGDTGFGAQTNGTLIDTDKKFNPNDLTVSGFAVTGLADSFNATVFYDKNGFEARFAANWRDTYLDHFGQSQNASMFGTEPTFVEASWSLDASLSYDITPQLSAYAEAQNILDAVYHTRGRFTEQLLDVVDYGRHMTVGVHYKL
jgi:TonB-dependent receptor